MGGWAAGVEISEVHAAGLSSADLMGDDSALHESVMFGEEAWCASPDTAPQPKDETTAMCLPAAGDSKDRYAQAAA